MDLEQLTASVTTRFAPVFQMLGPWNASLGDFRTALALIAPAEIAILWSYQQEKPLLPVVLGGAIFAWALSERKRTSYHRFEDEIREKGWSADICKRYDGIAQVWAEAHGQMDVYRRARNL